MRTVTTLKDAKFLALKEVKYPEKNVGRYLYAERLGVDSVAFVCIDRSKPKPYLLNKEYKPPVDQFILGAFGGSLDKEAENNSFLTIVKDEVREEAGYSVDKDDITFVGKVLVSTQMNQFCYLYVVNVIDSQKTEKSPENAIEAMSTTIWISDKDLNCLEDWKAPVIIARA